MEAHSEKSNVSEEDGDKGSTSEVEQKEDRDVQNGKVDDIAGPKGQLVQEEKREKLKVELGFLFTGIISRQHMEELLYPLYYWHMVCFSSFKLEAIIGWLWQLQFQRMWNPRLKAPFSLLSHSFGHWKFLFASLPDPHFLQQLGTRMPLYSSRKCICAFFCAPMSFFDTTPRGRILNRGSTDQSVVDMNISYQVGAFAFSMTTLLGIISVMSQVAWQVFFIFIPAIATCVWYQVTLMTSPQYCLSQMPKHGNPT